MTKVYIKTTQGTKGSQSAKRLAEALTGLLGYKVYRSTKEFPLKRSINYGAGVNKLAQYQWFKDNNVNSLEFTTDDTEADLWITEGHCVVGRQLLNSSCGKGIVLWDQTLELGGMPKCPVYTKYKKKKREFRVHIFQDKVVAVKEKRLRTNWEGPQDSKIRNLANGWVFCSCENEPEGLRELALQAAPVVKSDFAGVDVGYNEQKNELFVIEVNSAPGMEGTNVSAYAQAIVEKYNGV